MAPAAVLKDSVESKGRIRSIALGFTHIPVALFVSVPPTILVFVVVVFLPSVDCIVAVRAPSKKMSGFSI